MEILGLGEIKIPLTDYFREVLPKTFYDGVGAGLKCSVGFCTLWMGYKVMRMTSEFYEDAKAEVQKGNKARALVDLFECAVCGIAASAIIMCIGHAAYEALSPKSNPNNNDSRYFPIPKETEDLCKRIKNDFSKTNCSQTNLPRGDQYYCKSLWNNCIKNCGNEQTCKNFLETNQ